MVTANELLNLPHLDLASRSPWSEGAGRYWRLIFWPGHRSLNVGAADLKVLALDAVDYQSQHREAFVSKFYWLGRHDSPSARSFRHKLVLCSSANVARGALYLIADTLVPSPAVSIKAEGHPLGPATVCSPEALEKAQLVVGHSSPNAPRKRSCRQQQIVAARRPR
jgi:hypothetical protein